jgi:hypothetical protein
LLSELYYRNDAGNSYADVVENKVAPNPNIHLGKPIFKDKTGKRLMLEKEL